MFRASLARCTRSRLSRSLATRTQLMLARGVCTNRRLAPPRARIHTLNQPSHCIPRADISPYHSYCQHHHYHTNYAGEGAGYTGIHNATGSRWRAGACLLGAAAMSSGSCDDHDEPHHTTPTTPHPQSASSTEQPNASVPHSTQSGPRQSSIARAINASTDRVDAHVLTDVFNTIRDLPAQVMDAHRSLNADTYAIGMGRLFRNLWYAGRIYTNYVWKLAAYDKRKALLRGNKPPSVHCSQEPAVDPERAAIVAECHAQGAELLRDLFFANAGVYIKLGQIVSTSQYLVPDQYCEAATVFQEAAPGSSEEDVRAVILEDLGAPVEEVFDQFDWDPVASASLAQVHKAVYKGHPVAVKVQHRWLRALAHTDTVVVSWILNRVHDMFGEVADFRWFAQEMEDNLPLELDFEREGRNCEQAGCHLAHLGDVVTPSIHWDATTPRVLTMEWMDGVRVNQLDDIRAQNISTREVGKVLCRLLAHQIFHCGAVHADTHPGNVLVRPHPDNSVSATVVQLQQQPSSGGNSQTQPQAHATGSVRPELVLLDHGLYRKYSDSFRLLYARLWLAILTSDVKGMEECCKALNCEELTPILVAMLTRKPYSQATDESRSVTDRMSYSKDQKSKAMLQDWMVENGLQVTKVLSSLPAEMLLLLKTNDVLASVCMELGNTEHGDGVSIMLLSALKAVQQDRLQAVGREYGLWTDHSCTPAQDESQTTPRDGRQHAPTCRKAQTPGSAPACSARSTTSHPADGQPLEHGHEGTECSDHGDMCGDACEVTYPRVTPVHPHTAGKNMQRARSVKKPGFWRRLCGWMRYFRVWMSNQWELLKVHCMLFYYQWYILYIANPSA